MQDIKLVFLNFATYIYDSKSFTTYRCHPIAHRELGQSIAW